MMDIYYLNSAGVKIDLLKGSYRMQTADLFDFTWDYSFRTNRYGNKINSFSKGMATRSILISIMANKKAAYYNAINAFYDATNYDVVTNSPGRLYIGKRYISCYVFQSKKTEWEYGIELLDNEFDIVIENPVWVKETVLAMQGGNVPTVGGLGYPRGYPHGYGASKANNYIINDSPESVNFRMEIYGYVNTPTVTIGDNIYRWHGIVYYEEYLVIDSKAQTVTRYLIDGTPINGFAFRDKEYSIFKKIPPGRSLVTLSDKFSVNITALEERGEPEWSL